MTVELFQGTPEALQIRLAAIIAGAGTINTVMLTHAKSVYLIMWV